MKSLALRGGVRFLFAFLLVQLLQAGRQTPPGVVTGIVRSESGAPAAGVRVYAISVRDASEAAGNPAPLESQAQTDAAGRYKLELPPGRYYLASGSVSTPTYYPGTLDVATARALTVGAGDTIQSIDLARQTCPN